MTVHEIRALLSRLDGEPADAIESEEFDCKELPASSGDRAKMLRETAVCFANRLGGVILLGVADRKRTRADAIVGVSPDIDSNDLKRTIFDGTEPPIVVEIEELAEPEGRLLAIRVPRGTMTHTTSEGMSKIRVGKECKPLTGSLRGSAAQPPDATVAIRREVYSCAVGLVRTTAGQFFNTSDGATSSLPGALWHPRGRGWVKVVERFGEFEHTKGRFRPYVEPAMFDGSDGTFVAAAREILELYLWSSINHPDFNAIRTALSLPDADRVAAILRRVEDDASSQSDPGTQRAAVESAWECVDFSTQTDLKPALLGNSLGPAQVAACPRIREVDDIVRGLEEAAAVAVVGPSGCGKSMAAWHAAHQLYQQGWAVYVLAQPRAAHSGLPQPTQRTLMIVDDMQAFHSPPVNAALACGNRRLLVVSTEPVPGFRRTVHIIAEGAVAALAEGLASRATDLMPLLRSLDARVGEGPSNESVEFRIGNARRASKLPWQFMFNLGGGELRVDASLKALSQAPPRDTILFVVAAGQLATTDAGARLTWIEDFLRRHSVAVDDLRETIREIDSRVPLLRVADRVSTPHAQMADRIVAELLKGRQAAARRDMYWALFEEPPFALGGLAWLIGPALCVRDAVPSDLVDRLIARCRDATNGGQAGFVLASLLWYWGIPAERVETAAISIRGWLAAGAPEYATGLARLVNELLNADRSDELKARGGGSSGTGAASERIVSGVAAIQVASWANGIRLEDGTGQAELLERLGAAGSLDWCRQVGALLDRARLAATVRSARPDQLREVTRLILGVLMFDQELARYLAGVATPAIVAAMRTSVPDGYSSAQDIFSRVLGFHPHFLRSREPDKEQHAMAAALLEGVGAEALAAQLSGARRRDWNMWAHFSVLLREAAPELASAVGGRLSAHGARIDTGERARGHSRSEGAPASRGNELESSGHRAGRGGGGGHVGRDLLP